MLLATVQEMEGAGAGEATVMEKKKVQQEKEEEEGDDPGMIILLADDASIDACLQLLPGIAPLNIGYPVPPLVPGR